MACALCHAVPADFFSSTGDPLCRVCFHAGQQAVADQRAHDSLAEQGQLATGLADKSPQMQMLAGGGIMVASVALAVGIALLTGTLYFYFGFLFVAGVAIFARGFTNRAS